MAIAMIIIVLTSSSGFFIPISTSTAGSTTGKAKLDEPVITHLRQEQQALEDSVDATKAVGLSLGSGDFQRMTADSKWTFNSIFDRFSFSVNASEVSVTLESVNVAYSLIAPGPVGLNIIVTENPPLTQVLSVATQQVPRFSQQNSHNYSGYEFLDCHLQPGPGTCIGFNWYQPIYEVSAQWNTPYVSEPYAWACFNHKCDIATWVGLCNVSGCTDNNIVQAGTDSGVYCSAGCQTFYQAIYEFAPNNSVYCYWWPAGVDNIVDVYSKYVTSGNPNDVPNYTVNIYSTNGQSCGTSNNYYPAVSQPHYAEFINERPYWGSPWNYYARLPSFYDGGPEWITSCQINAQSTHAGYPATWCYPMWSQGWDNYFLMNLNGCNPPDNIALLAVQSDSSFSQRFLTACGT